MLAQWIIEKKRDGQALTEEEIRFLVDGYTRGKIPDYQMSAFAMAVFLRGMSSAELAAFTDAMMRSGEVLDLSSIPGPKVDKHSTGGIGDKVSLVLAPLAACGGVSVPMIAGRGLGLTGGTIDKLEAIPGYRTDLSAAEFTRVVRTCGCSIMTQTARLAPADRKLYALRDVTGTVPSIPLIASSIMSKKLAEGADALVLDVKWGRGAFMRSRAEARELARAMVTIGRRMGRGMRALLSDMNQPTGRAVGNAVEVAEAVEALQGRGPRDLMEITFALGAQMLILGRRARTVAEAKRVLRRHLDSGAAFEKFKEMVRLHGGDPRALDDPRRLPRARLREAVVAARGGYVADVDAERIGRACVMLGAGRRTVGDRIDPAAGITGLMKAGERVERGQPLLILHANRQSVLAEGRSVVSGAFRLVAAPVAKPSLGGEIIRNV